MASDRTRWRVDLGTTVVIILTCVGLLWANRDGLRRARSAPRVALPEHSLTLEGAIVEGSPSAPVVIVMYTDYQCPYCARFEQTTLKQIREMYIETGRVRLAVRHYPLEAIHPRAFAAAVAAICAHKLGNFRALHKRLFEHQKDLDPELIQKLAGEAELDLVSFTECTGNEESARNVRADIAAGQSLGLTGTPTFLIGTAEGDTKVKVDSVISGNRPLQEFTRALDSLLDPWTFPTTWLAPAVVGSLLAGTTALLRRRRRSLTMARQ